MDGTSWGKLFAAFVALMTASGCATITSSDVQSLALTTHSDQGQPVEKVKCTARNDKGAWEAESPAFLQVRRSAEDLIVECRKEGHQNGFLRAVSRAAGSMFGNIIIGGGIGALIDHSRGTGYNYPDNLPVRMGQSVVVDRRHETPQQTPDPGKPAAPAASVSPADAAAAGKKLAGNELINLFSTSLKFRMTEPADLHALEFRSGYVYAEFSNATRSGTHRVSNSNEVCLSMSVPRNAHDAGSSPMAVFLQDCFTVSLVSARKYRFTSRDGSFSMIGEI